MPLDDSNWVDVKAEIESDTALGALLRARRRVTAGWCQHFTHLRSGADVQYCAVGALRQELWEVGATPYLEMAVPPGYGRSVILYNDSRGRTQAEVVALYDRAIALCRAGRG